MLERKPGLSVMNSTLSSSNTIAVTKSETLLFRDSMSLTYCRRPVSFASFWGVDK